MLSPGLAEVWLIEPIWGMGPVATGGSSVAISLPPAYMYSLVSGSGVGDCIGEADLEVERLGLLARAASLRRADGAETRLPRPPWAATMPVAAIEASRSATASMALRRERSIGTRLGLLLRLADDFLSGLADDFLPGLFLDIPLLSSPDQTNHTNTHDSDKKLTDFRLGQSQACASPDNPWRLSYSLVR